MTSYYFKSDPARIEEIADDIMAAWVETGNPKAQQWEEVPSRPDGAIWQGGQWVISEPPLPEPDWNRFASEISTGALKDGFDSLCQQLTDAGQMPLLSLLISQISVIQLSGQYQILVDIWRQCLPYLTISPQVGGALLQTATECQLPTEFIFALLPPS